MHSNLIINSNKCFDINNTNNNYHNNIFNTLYKEKNKLFKNNNETNTTNSKSTKLFKNSLLKTKTIKKLKSLINIHSNKAIINSNKEIKLSKSINNSNSQINNSLINKNIDNKVILNCNYKANNVLDYILFKDSNKNLFKSVSKSKEYNYLKKLVDKTYCKKNYSKFKNTKLIVKKSHINNNKIYLSSNDIVNQRKSYNQNKFTLDSKLKTFTYQNKLNNNSSMFNLNKLIKSDNNSNDLLLLEQRYLLSSKKSIECNNNNNNYKDNKILKEDILKKMYTSDFTKNNLKCNNYEFNKDDNANLLYLVKKLNSIEEIIFKYSLNKDKHKSSINLKCNASSYNKLIDQKSFNLNKNILKSNSIQIKKRNNILKFPNLYDSLSENEDYNEEYIEKTFSINPESKFAIIWTQIYELFIVFYIFYYGVALAFPYYRAWNIIDIFIVEFILTDLIIFINMIITLVKGFYKNNLISYSMINAYKNNKAYINLHVICCFPLSLIKFIIIANNNLNKSNNISKYNKLLLVNNNFYIEYNLLLKDNNLEVYSLEYINNINLINQINYFFKFLLIFIISKWINLSYIYTQINNYIEYSIVNLNSKTKIYKLLIFIGYIKGLIGMLIYFLLIAHICSSFFIFSAKYNLNNNKINWLIQYNLLMTSNFNQYSSALYFILTTFLTVGYGDIIPTNIFERVIVNFLLVLGVIFYSYMVAVLSSLFMENNKYIIIYNKKLSILDEIEYKYPDMKKNLKKKIKRRIHLDYVKGEFAKLEFFNYLPSVVKNELIYKMYYRKIAKLDMFNILINNKNRVLKLDSSIYSNYYSRFNLFNQSIDLKKLNYQKILNNEEFICFIMPLLQLNVHNKGELIWNYNEQIEEMFLIIKGKLKICLGYQYLDYCLGYMRSGKNFGEVTMFSNESNSSYNIYVHSKKAELFTLSKKNFQLVRETFPKIVKIIISKSIKNYTDLEASKFIATEYYNLNLTFKGLSNLLNRINNEYIFNLLFNRNSKDTIKKTEINKESNFNLIHKKSNMLTNGCVMKKLNNKKDTHNIKTSQISIDNNVVHSSNNSIKYKRTNRISPVLNLDKKSKSFYNILSNKDIHKYRLQNLNKNCYCNCYFKKNKIPRCNLINENSNNIKNMCYINLHSKINSSINKLRSNRLSSYSFISKNFTSNNINKLKKRRNNLTSKKYGINTLKRYNKKCKTFINNKRYLLNNNTIENKDKHKSESNFNNLKYLFLENSNLAKYINKISKIKNIINLYNIKQNVYKDVYEFIKSKKTYQEDVNNILINNNKNSIYKKSYKVNINKIYLEDNYKSSYYASIKHSKYTNNNNNFYTNIQSNLYFNNNIYTCSNICKNTLDIYTNTNNIFLNLKIIKEINFAINKHADTDYLINNKKIIYTYNNYDKAIYLDKEEKDTNKINCKIKLKKNTISNKVNNKKESNYNTSYISKFNLNKIKNIKNINITQIDGNNNIHNSLKNLTNIKNIDTISKTLYKNNNNSNNNKLSTNKNSINSINSGLTIINNNVNNYILKKNKSDELNNLCNDNDNCTYIHKNDKNLNKLFNILNNDFNTSYNAKKLTKYNKNFSKTIKLNSYNSHEFIDNYFNRYNNKSIQCNKNIKSTGIYFNTSNNSKYAHLDLVENLNKKIDNAQILDNNKNVQELLKVFLQINANNKIKNKLKNKNKEAKFRISKVDYFNLRKKN